MGDKIAIDFGTAGASYSITANTVTLNTNSEGTTVVTDNGGILQFWAGSNTVYNRNQQVMDNGAGLTGTNTSTQNVVAFAAPGVAGKYFVVTTTGAANATTPTLGSLYYSVVDMTANSGLGAVTSTKNVLVPGSAGLSSEVLTAVPTSDGLGHWVITTQYNSSNLVAIKFDANGPVGASVITTLSRPIGNYYGTAYFNPRFDRFVVLSSDRVATNGSYAFLMEFNATTGAATELAAWQVPVAGAADPNVGPAGNTRAAYAADFSPSGDYVYVSQIYPGRLWRYDVRVENSADIEASEEFVGATGGGGGHIRRGPDGAMWVANLGNTSLTRIPNPDAATVAATGFAMGNIALPAGVTSYWGLPQTVAGCAAVMSTGGGGSTAAAVPTLNEWALGLLALAMLGMAGLRARRRV